jgi:hypothetical protein
MLKLAMYSVLVFGLFYFGIAQVILAAVATMALWGAAL